MQKELPVFYHQSPGRLFLSDLPQKLHPRLGTQVIIDPMQEIVKHASLSVR